MEPGLLNLFPFSNVILINLQSIVWQGSDLFAKPDAFFDNARCNQG